MMKLEEKIKGEKERKRKEYIQQKRENN